MFKVLINEWPCYLRNFLRIGDFELFFQSLQKKTCADDLKRVEDPTASLNQRIEVAEKLVEEGDKLLKLCVPKTIQAFFPKATTKDRTGSKKEAGTEIQISL